MRSAAFLLAVSLVTPILACGSSVDGQTSSDDAGGHKGHSGDGGGGAAPSPTAGPSTSTGAGGTLDHGMPSDVYPAFKPLVPYVANSGGPRIAAPNVYPIFFSSETDTSILPQIQDFVNRVGATSYWTAAVSEYGVGPLTGNPAITLDDDVSGNISDADIQDLLAARIADGSLPAPDANTVYSFFFPEATSISLQGSQSCQEFGGYHNDAPLPDGTFVPYTVVPRCSFDMSQIDTLTGSTSHEFVEAATDPIPQEKPAYQTVDNNHFYWAIALGGGETGDMCAQQESSFVVLPELPYMVQRPWSNAAARAYHDPCVPTVDSSPYFNAAPVLPDQFIIQGVPVNAVHIPVGTTRTVEIDLFSDGPTGPWEVDFRDASWVFGGPQTLAFQADRTGGQNGEKMYVEITSTQQSQFGASVFFISSKLGDKRSVWIGLVSQ